MDFYQSQDSAKRNTSKLIFLFALAVGSLILITNLLVMLAMGYGQATSANGNGSLVYDSSIALWVSGSVLTIIILGSLFKIGALSGGGARVAEMMNGKLLPPGQGDFYQRRVLNVVEEMAIASGTPVPPVYLIDEMGINAFAAGYTTSDAVIGVTRGTIECLTREQLQGVVAHEFSHILHGDMRINIRLMGVLHGILMLATIGYYLARSSSFGRRSKERNGLVALGIGLLIVGYAGTFFGNLIKAAVSRQREYLADASAVQFTRNPEGIGEALMRIATHDGRSYMDNPATSEISHSLFEEGIPSSLHKLYATHPPLDQRIQAVMPRWNGDYSVARVERRRGPDDASNAKEHKENQAQERREKLSKILTGGMLGENIPNTGLGIVSGFSSPSSSRGISAEDLDQAVDNVGMPQPQHLQQADVLLLSLPQILLDAAHSAYSARAVIYYLILDSDEKERQTQLDYLSQRADEGVYDDLQQLIRKVPDEVKASAKTSQESEQSLPLKDPRIDRELRLPLVNIALSSLRQLSAQQYDLFRKNFRQLVVADDKVSLFEWSLQRIVFHHLDIVFKRKKVAAIGRNDLLQEQSAAALLMSVLAHAGRQQGVSVEHAYQAGHDYLKGMSWPLFPLGEISAERLDQGVTALAGIKPLQKPLLLKALAAVITADGEVTVTESELFRAIAETLDCPMPPLA